MLIYNYRKEIIMDKIVVKMKDVAKMDEWKNAEKKSIEEYCHHFNSPFKDIEIYIVETSLDLKCYNKGTYVNLYLMIDNQSCGNYRVRLTDMKIIKNKTKTLQNTDVPIDTLNKLAKFYMLLMIYISTYRKSIEPQKDKSENKQIGNKKKKNKPRYTYIFNSNYSSEYKGGHHASPSYAFKVRGHYRNLKNGKRIWVREYIKCEGKPKERKYRL
jgi:hypothetical protein